MINKKHVKQIELNLKAVDKSLGQYKNLIEMFDAVGWGAAISMLRMHGLKCIGCSGDVTGPILNFFNFDVTKCLCYDCQKANK